MLKNNRRCKLSLKNLKKGRYLLILDILGFSALVEQKSPAKIYKVIDDALEAFSDWEKLNKQFKTIYFSDTFVFYQEPKGYGDWAFLDVYAIGAMLLSALLAQGIPARGAITFGEFEVRIDSRNKHQVYFGKALVEAYKAERKENWIGITIQPSAWMPYEFMNEGSIDLFSGEGNWKKRHDGVLMLNPFRKLTGWYPLYLAGDIKKPYMKWDRPAFLNDILGFKFLHEQAAFYARNGDFSSKEAVKYHSTVAFLREILSKEVYEWGMCLGLESKRR